MTNRLYIRYYQAIDTPIVKKKLMLNDSHQLFLSELGDELTGRLSFKVGNKLMSDHSRFQYDEGILIIS